MSCHKCKQAPPQVGDSWCLACSGWEALGVELGGRWGNPALRALAEEAVVGAVRQVRGLRKLANSLSAAAGSGRASVVPEAAGTSTTAKATPPRPPLPRNPPPLPKQEVAESEDVEEEEEESEGSDRREREEPEAATPVRRERGSERPVTPIRSTGDHLPERDRSRRRGSGRDHRGHHSSRRHRGGRKHKRLARGLTDPSLPLHRSTPGSYWDLAPDRQGLGALPRHR